MDIFGFDQASFLSFLLTLMRTSLVVFFLPFFGGENVPIQLKAILCLILTCFLWPHLSFPGAVFPAHPFAIMLMLLEEALLGMILALAVNFIFAGIQTGGELLGMHMGFTMVNLADPSTGAQVGLTSHLMHSVALVVFLIFDGHLHLLRALADSFALIGPGGLKVTPMLVQDILTMSGQMFLIAIKIAAPVIAAIFMVEMTLALMGRAAPQMNLITMGFPLKIAVGFYFMAMLFAILSGFMEDFIVGLAPMFQNIMRLAR